MRLTQIKLAGFKSFVDPTSIATPGQLVGIVGPNGCGKSNVIDAVRWVLGESKASALRGESMQDVIFNGAGERKPVGRASVELFFDNSQGRIGGQWGQYAELSIKRVLTRDGDSTYYINNIPVRRRDIHDLFLGTGLGPRAYAIIEQGTISRVVEAKPEELRIFLEEAAGVSKYKERRKETEGRLADTRENLARVEDIRLELSNQLAKLTDQARVAGEYRELEDRARRAQHVLWYARQQEAVRAKAKCAADVSALTVQLEATQAELRACEARLEALRSDHYAAGDALHEKQGAFYAANAEVTKLEQQLEFARDSESRLAEQHTQMTEVLTGLAMQQTTLVEERTAAERALEAAIGGRATALANVGTAQEALPALDQAVATASEALAAIQEDLARFEQEIGVATARRDAIAESLGQSGERRARLDDELAALAPPEGGAHDDVREQLEQEQAELEQKQAAHAKLQTSVQSLQEQHRTAGEQWQRTSRALADLEARADALAALQARIGHGQDIEGWLATRGLTHARRLWQALDIEPGWEDALEAVMRERLNALELAHLDDAQAWQSADHAPPGRIAAYAPATARHGPQGAPDSLLAKVRLRNAAIGRVVADWLHGIRCRDDLAPALAERSSLGPGEAFVTPAGQLVTAQGISFFAPDDELHGVLARQRELAELARAIDPARIEASDARAALDTVEVSLKEAQTAWQQESQALASQQRRCHDLELELTELKQTLEAADRRRSQIAEETADLESARVDAERQREALALTVADAQSRSHDALAGRDGAREKINAAQTALDRGRESLREAERASQEADFTERSSKERLAEIDRRSESLTAQVTQQQALAARLSSERASIDWTPVEEALQRQLKGRTAAEQALSAARDRVEALGAELRTVEEARLTIEQQLEPARARIQDAKLKEQAAQLAEQQFSDQLAEAHADVDALPEALKAWGSARTLPAEIERLQASIAELGPVNLAALDELTQATERKDYLDRQAADLTEAMSTLESAIRQIDRESRELLQQTFDQVNTNFARLFPVLFGGGNARLVLTGEEILDSGVQVFAQPPGKRYASIHLLSGGEKALTAISLVFALFQLNPAPFCLLDEVDAPLDDPNTDRFCRLVRDMTGETQFVFISHNKITMEMATQLVGITMPEPGVSRVVAVDIAEALELAESKPAPAVASAT